MSAAAIERGYKFIAITEGLKIAGGLKFTYANRWKNETAMNRESSRPGRRDAVVSCYLRQG